MAGKELSPQGKAREVETPGVDAKPDKADLGLEYGVEYNLPFAAPYSDGLSRKAREEKELRELIRGWGEEEGPTIAQLIAMRRTDGQARALYRLLTLPIRAALEKSTFLPADGGEAEAEFIDQVFNLPPSQGGMSVTFHKFMAQLLQALFDGFAPFEQVYWMPTVGPLKGKYTLRKLAYRQADTISVVEDEDGHFQGFRQRAYVNGKTIDTHIPRERSFYYAAQEEERKYYGVSFFQSAFYHYDKKVKMYYIAHLAAQRAAVGTRLGTFPANFTAEQRRAFAQNLENVAFAQWMMIPEGAKVDTLKESASFQFLDYINHHNNQMSKSVLANFFDKDTGGGSGDAKLVSFGQPGDDMFVLMLRAIMSDIANQINHYIIPRLIDWNFTGGKYPKFQWAELTDDEKVLISSTFDRLSTAGESVNVSEEFLRQIEKKMAAEMGLEIDWDEVEEREAIQKEGQNLLQGLDADGKPLPKDPEGNPMLPGQPASPAQQLSDFEASISSSGSMEDIDEEDLADEDDEENKKKVALSEETHLLEMAEDLLKLARPTSRDYRTVRTPEGAERFGVPIGQQIPNSAGRGEAGGDRKVTVERLLSLKSQFEEFKDAGNEDLARKAMLALRQAVYQYTGSWKPEDFLDTMRKIEHDKD